MPPSLGLLNLLEWLPEHSKTLTLTSLLLRDMVKNTDEHPYGRDVYSKVCGKKYRTFVPCPGMALSPLLPLFANMEALQTSYFGDFMEASSYRNDQSSLALHTSEENVSQAENSQLLMMAWSFPWLSLIQEPPRNPARITSLAQKDILTTWGNYKISGILCQKQRSKTVLEQEMLLIFLSLKIIKVWTTLCQELGADTNTYFLLSHSVIDEPWLLTQ